MTKLTIDVGSAFRKLPADSVAAVLNGIEITTEARALIRSIWESHENGNFSAAVKAITAALDGKALGWPWFEWCLAKFSDNKIWPDIPAWSWFEPIKPEPKPRTRDDALNWLSLSEVKKILKAEGIQPVSNKRADIFNAMYQQVEFGKWSGLAFANWQHDCNTKPDQTALEQAKIKLLVMTLTSAKYSAHRVAQISESLANWPRGTQAKIDLADKAAALIAGASPRNIPLPNLPPFYPGDRSGLTVVFGKGLR